MMAAQTAMSIRDRELAAALLRLPVSALAGRPTPARIAEVKRLMGAGTLPAFLGRHLARYGRIDDATWAILREARA